MSTLLVCELSEIVAAGIAAVVEQLGCKVVARCRSGDEVLRTAELLRPDMILASTRALGEAAIATICTLQADSCRPRIILLVHTNPRTTAADLAKFDVDGMLMRNASAATLLECVASLQQGRLWVDPDLLHHVARPEHTKDNLTSREREIVHLVALGMANKEIAREAKLSEGTVKTYLHRILVKLRLGNRTQLAGFAHSISQKTSAWHSRTDNHDRASEATGVCTELTERP